MLSDIMAVLLRPSVTSATRKEFWASNMPSVFHGLPGDVPEAAPVPTQTA